jgi:hypothetical protein
MKIIIVIILVAIGAYFVSTQKETPVKESSSSTHSSTEVLEDAFKNKKSDLQVTGQGTVIKVLPDDTKGSKHQRFILKLSNGQTILIAHNIDLAPRINGLRKGNSVSFNGEYEWNAKGGVVHWTHHDPRGKHENGWLRHNGKIYK